jgi:hypothetical protein
MLQRVYGSERAGIIQPERGMFVTMYFFNNWLPLCGPLSLYRYPGCPFHVLLEPF